jgi:hypothetical protein
MAHYHYIENTAGDLVDLKVYCSDWCNQQDSGPAYQGWNGCNELTITQPCENCEAEVKGLDEFGDIE